MNQDEIIKHVERYYSGKIKEFGPVPAGVDWNGVESQVIRFKQLTRIFDGAKNVGSVLDYGCGYGALLPFLKSLDYQFEYTGFDVSEEMIKSALNAQTDKARWITDKNHLEVCNYVVASGIFNVKGDCNNADWHDYVIATMQELNRLSRNGFSFNALTSYSDADRMKSYLYYVEPEKLFGHCKTVFSKSVALLHDYPLYEFTILVRKNIL
jgi:SAM-dependent methyltransferase